MEGALEAYLVRLRRERGEQLLELLVPEVRARARARDRVRVGLG